MGTLRNVASMIFDFWIRNKSCMGSTARASQKGLSPYTRVDLNDSSKITSLEVTIWHVAGTQAKWPLVIVSKPT